MKSGRIYHFGLIFLFAFIAGCAPEKTIVAEPKPAAIEAPSVAPERALETPAVTPSPAPEGRDKGPVITFKEPLHDFGLVGPSSSQYADFAFSNTGKEVLKIERFHAPCGCTIPELAKRDYAPGESGTIRVRYNAPAGAATEVKPIYVYTNDPETPQYELTVKAKVEVNVAISPDDVSLLLDQPNAGMPTLTITSKDGKEFVVTSVTASNEVMSVPFDRTKRAAKHVLEPRVDIERLQATPAGLVQVRTDHPQSGTLMVRYNAKPMFEISRPRIILQNILPGEEIVRDVWIRSNYEQKVEIESFSSSHGMMSIESQHEEGNHVQIMVKITAPADASAAGRRYITDELTIRLVSGQELSIRCSGWFRLS